MSSDESVTTRRHFFRRTSLALAAPLAAASTALGGDGNDTAARLAALEDANAIRALQRTYLRLVNAGATAELARLFADSTAVTTERDVLRIAAAALDDADDVVSIDAAGRTATARLTCTVERATALQSGCTLVEMARQQGEGVVRSTERRVLDGTYLKRAGEWKIASLSYRSI